MFTSKQVAKALLAMPGVLPSFYPSEAGVFFVQQTDDVFHIGCMTSPEKVSYEKYETEDRCTAFVAARTLAGHFGN